MKNALERLILATLLLFAVSTFAADKVVVVPLFSSDGKAEGDAVAADVLKGKSFSNDVEIGISGTRPPAPVARTAQTPAVPFDPATAGSDGALQKGVAWPNPRFTDNSDGTVTDNLTGLVWLKNASCFWTTFWINALSVAAALYDGWTGREFVSDGDCGLSDSSSAGDWRLPNIQELQSLIAYQYYDPALSNGAGTAKWSEGDVFSGNPSNYFWTSSIYANGGYAWSVHVGDGSVIAGGFSNNYSVWPVRDGQ